MPGQRKGRRKGRQKTRSSKAGITFPVGRVARYLKEENHAQRVGGASPVYMAAILEYVVADILELAGKTAKKNKKLRITPKHIQLALRNDDELSHFFGSKIIASITPKINPVLLPPKKKEESMKEEI
mmetsp:Transcript_99001/g.121205  ORF Transcript_99001/g.121205 Transcript_99001/m.121205 type:complete len:127 (-) Transcript_99001:143-523(-)